MRLLAISTYLLMIAINVPLWPLPLNALFIGLNVGLIWASFVNWIFEDVFT